jgi:hypothetical protein
MPESARALLDELQGQTRRRLARELVVEAALIGLIAALAPLGLLSLALVAGLFALALRQRLRQRRSDEARAAALDGDDLLLTALAIEAGLAAGGAALQEAVRAQALAQVPTWRQRGQAADRALRSRRAAPLCALALLCSLQHLHTEDGRPLPTARSAAVAGAIPEALRPDGATQPEALPLPAAAGELQGEADRIGQGVGEEARAAGLTEAAAAAEPAAGAQAGGAIGAGAEPEVAAWGIAKKRQDKPEGSPEGTALPGQLARWGENEADLDRPLGEGRSADLGAGQAGEADIRAEDRPDSDAGQQAAKGKVSGGGEGATTENPSQLTGLSEEAEGALSDAVESGSGAAGQGGVNESSGSLWSEVKDPGRSLRLAEERVSEQWRSGASGPLRALDAGPSGGDSTIGYAALFTAYAALAEAQADPATPPARAAFVRAYFDAIAPEAK